MKGYGLTVFAGSSIERFDVEVLGVIRNAGPDRATIVVRVSGHGLDENGIAAGMSGSPVYLDGKLAGAVASTWGFAKIPIGGVTPIESMLSIDPAKASAATSPAASVKRTGSSATAGGGGLEGIGDWRGSSTGWFRKGIVDAMSLDDEAKALFLTRLFAGRVALRENATQGSLLTPVAFGFPPETFERFRGPLENLGLTSLFKVTTSLGPGGLGPLTLAGNAAIAGGSSKGAPSPARPLEGGAAIAALLIDGDLRLGATGTVTAVFPDGRFLAFGHPFLAFGELDLPVASAEIVTTFPSVFMSFKIGYPLAPAFRMTRDRDTGIAGRTDGSSTMVPVSFRFEDEDGALRNFSFRVASHPKLLPILVAMAGDAALNSADPTPRERTIQFRVSIDTAAGRMTYTDRATGLRAKETVLMTAGLFATAVADNEFQEPAISGIELVCRSGPGERRSRLLDAALSERRVAPGGTLTAIVRLSDRRGEETTRVLRIAVPKETPEGRATLFVSDGGAATALKLSLSPAEPRSLADFGAWIASLKSSDQLVASILLPSRAIATGSRTLSALPPSASAVLHAARHQGESGASEVDSRYLIDTAIPLDRPLAGSIRLEFEVEARRL